MLKRTHLLVAVLAAASLTVACGSDEDAPEAWWFEESGPNAPGPEPASAPDPEPLPEPDPTPVPDPEPEPEPPPEPEPEPCFEAGLHYVDPLERYQRDRHVIVADDRVFVARSEEPGEQRDVYEWTEEGLELIVGTDADEVPVAATGPFVFVHGDDVVRRIHTRSNEQPPLEMIARPPNGIVLGMRQPRQRVSDQVFGFLDESVVHLLHSDGSMQSSYQTSTWQTLWVEGNSAVWVSAEPRTIQYVSDAGDTALGLELGSGEEAQSPVLAGGYVYFMKSGAIWRWDPANGTREPVLDDRVCGPLHTDGATLVTACDPFRRDGEYQYDYFQLQAIEVWTIDGETGDTDLVHLTSSPAIFGPVIDGRWIAWTHYSSYDLSDPFPVGPVEVLDRRNPERGPTAVGTMGQGCQTCGAYWPPPYLDLDGSTVVFTYAQGPDDPPLSPGDQRYGYIGVARLGNCD